MHKAGRKPKYDEDMRRKIGSEWLESNDTKTAIAKRYGISIGTLDKYIKEARTYQIIGSGVITEDGREIPQDIWDIASDPEMDADFLKICGY